MNRITEQRLEFDKIKEIWAGFAMTEAAKKQIYEMEPCLEERTLRRWQRETTEARLLIEKCGNPPLVSFEGIPHLLDVAEKEGCLTPEQLEAVGDTLVAIKRLKAYLNLGKAREISLAFYEENLAACDEVREQIRLQIRGGRVDDNATRVLAEVRSELANQEVKMREKAEQIMRSNKECMADSFLTTRSGRICVPVKKDFRSRIGGSVLDKSATGSTVFIEPTAVGRYYEQIQLLKIDEENEEMRIRYELTALILNELEAFRQNMKTVEMLDFAFSKGKLSLEYGGVEPRINTDRRISLKDARHPLMDRRVSVPLQFEIGGDIRGIIITGPNTGGKTVSIKTVALNSMMAQCGLHVACEEADICMNANYLCDIGDGQNLAENLSTFSAHLKNILGILAEVSEESLVVMDELGSGTDPAEGMGIAIAVLEELKKSGALFLVTTHYPEVKQYARNESAVINARMGFDRENLKPTYQLIIGEAGESCAFAIAKRLGMAEDMLAVAARAAYGSRTKNDQSGVVQMEMESHRDEDRILGGADPGDEGTPGRTAENTAGSPKKNIRQKSSHKIQKIKEPKNNQEQARKFNLGDSVMVYPDRKIGIVCETANEKGVLRVQLQDRKIWISHKRIKLHVAAEELYPADYDFSIIFDTVENRKMRHQMDRKFVEEGEIRYEEDT